jgi:hypothetical protein
MEKLTRNADGSYSGSYKGRQFTVRKEQVESCRGRHPETVWAARCGTIHWQCGPDGTRKDAVRMLLHMLDMSDVSVPEIDDLLQRWTKEVQAIVPLLSEHDTSAPFMLSELKNALRDVERDVLDQIGKHGQHLGGKQF